MNFLLPHLRRHPAFAEGARASVHGATGLAAWGLMTGVAMSQSGMSTFESVLMTLIVYAGSSQLAAIPLIMAGAPFWVILATGFCVNLRFVVFSLHLRQYLMHLPRWARLLHGYVTADISYVSFVQHHPQPGRTPAEQRAQEAWLAGCDGLMWLAWVGSSLLGIGLAQWVPTQWGLGFAAILCLLGILCSLASTRLRVLAAAVATVTAISAWSLPLKLNIVLAIGAAVLLTVGVERGLKSGARA